MLLTGNILSYVVVARCFYTRMKFRMATETLIKHCTSVTSSPLELSNETVFNLANNKSPKS